ncbi:hypothetical protein BHE74_00059680, partial [Ensete ventricosum]
GDIASFLLPTRGDVSSPRAGRRNRQRATDRDRESTMSVQVLPLLLSPSVDTARNQPPMVKINRNRLTAASNG